MHASLHAHGKCVSAPIGVHVNDIHLRCSKLDHPCVKDNLPSISVDDGLPLHSILQIKNGGSLSEHPCLKDSV